MSYYWQAVNERELLRKEIQTVPSSSGTKPPTPRYQPQELPCNPSTSTSYRGPKKQERFKPIETSTVIPQLNTFPSRAVIFEIQPSTSRGTPGTVLCWKCGEKGHLRSECPNPGKLFCSRCLKPKVLTKVCLREPQGNVTKAVWRGCPSSFR